MVTSRNAAAGKSWRDRLREERAHQAILDALDSISRYAEALPFYSRWAIVDQRSEVRLLCERSPRPPH